jgi:hypothetical protein
VCNNWTSLEAQLGLSYNSVQSSVTICALYFIIIIIDDGRQLAYWNYNAFESTGARRTCAGEWDSIRAP